LNFSVGHSFKRPAQRTITIEFESVEQAIAASAYQEALAALGNTCERDMRIVEGVG
jgi:uncharacterized protein (DUF1330 family)